MKKIVVFFLLLFTLILPLSTPYAASLDLSKEYGFGRLPNGEEATVGGAINNLVQPAFTIAGVAVVFYLIIGAVKFITAAGEKEAVQGARNMIVHAIIGIVLLLFMFLFLRWFPDALGLKNFRFF